MAVNYDALYQAKPKDAKPVDYEALFNAKPLPDTGNLLTDVPKMLGRGLAQLPEALASPLQASAGYVGKLADRAMGQQGVGPVEANINYSLGTARDYTTRALQNKVEQVLPYSQGTQRAQEQLGQDVQGITENPELGIGQRLYQAGKSALLNPRGSLPSVGESVAQFLPLTAALRGIGLGQAAIESATTLNASNAAKKAAALKLSVAGNALLEGQGGSQGAREDIAQTDLATLRSQPDFQDLERRYGTEQAVKVAQERAGSEAYLPAGVLGGAASLVTGGGAEGVLLGKLLNEGAQAAIEPGFKGGLKYAAKEVAKGLSREVPEETLQGASGQFGQNMGEQPFTGTDLAKGVPEQAASSGVAGLFSGGAYGGAGAGLDIARGPLSRAVNTSPDAVAQSAARVGARKMEQEAADQLAQEQETAKQADAANKKIITDAKAKETAAKAQAITDAGLLKQQQEKLNGASNTTGIRGVSTGADGSDSKIAGANSDIGKLTAEQSDGVSEVQGVHGSENLGEQRQQQDLTTPANAAPLTQEEIINGQTKTANEEKTPAHDAGQDAKDVNLSVNPPGTLGDFTPTHELSDGTPVIQTGENTFVDAQGEESQGDAYTTPLKTEKTPQQAKNEPEITNQSSHTAQQEQPKGTHPDQPGVVEAGGKTTTTDVVATAAKTDGAEITNEQQIANDKIIVGHLETILKEKTHPNGRPFSAIEIQQTEHNLQTVKDRIKRNEPTQTSTEQQNPSVPLSENRDTAAALPGAATGELPTAKTTPGIDTQSPAPQTQPVSVPAAAQPVANAKGVTRFSESAAKAILTSSKYPDVSAKTHEIVQDGDKWQVVKKTVAAQPEQATDKKNLLVPIPVVEPFSGQSSGNALNVNTKTGSNISVTGTRQKQLNNILDRISPLDNGNMQTSLDKTVADSLSSHAKMLSDFTKTDAFISHGYSGLDVPTRRMVIDVVRSLVSDNEIGNGIIQSIPINVMHNFTGKKFSSEMLLHNKTMGENASSVNAKRPISVSSNAAITELISTVAKILTGETATNISVSGNMTGTSINGIPTNDTINEHIINSSKVDKVLGDKAAETALSPSIIPKSDPVKQPSNTQATETKAEPVNTEVEKSASERLGFLADKLSKVAKKTDAEHFAQRDIEFVIDSLVKYTEKGDTESVNHLIAKLSKASVTLFNNHAPASKVIDEVVEQLQGKAVKAKAPEAKTTAKQTWVTPEYAIRLDKAKLKLRRAIETTAFDALTSDPTAPADNDTIISDLLAHLIQEKVTAKQANDTGQQEMLDLMLDGNKITIPSEFIESVKKQRSKNFKDNELAKNREPAIYHEAVAKALIIYGKTGGITAEEITDFTLGFDHHLAGKTLSTLPPGSKAMIAGFKAAEDWTKTEEGNAWFKGEKRAKKLEATGTVLKRWFDKSKADIDGSSKTDADIAKAQIDAATTRAAFFRDIAGENPTPGLLRYLDAVRSKITPFKEWFVSELGLIHYRSERGWDSLITDYLKDGATIRRITDLKHDTVEQRIANLKQFAARYVDEIGQIVEVVAGTSDMRTASDKLAKAFLNDDVYKDMYKKIEGARGWEFYANSSHYSPLAKKLEALIASSDIRRLLPAYVEGQFDKENDAGASKPISPRNPRIEQVYRNGKDWRKGKDITPKQFKDKFGFADFNFGKYVTKKNDQDHLNYAYDALSDFAGLMDIDPKAIGSNGKLYFTIGALGHGKFAAHFSPNNPSDKGPVPVINLTNTKGDGTVSHEWLHFLDHIAASSTQLDNAIQTIKQELKQAYDYDGMKRRVISHLKGGAFFTHLKNDRIASARRAITSYTGRGHSNFYNAALALDKGNLSKPYWSNDKEPFARAGEAAVMDLLEDKQLTNNYLVNNDFVGEGKAAPPLYKGTPYPMGEERKRFKEWYSALFKAMSYTDGKWNFDSAKFRELAPKTSEDYERAIAGLSASIPDMYRQLQDEQRAGELLKDMEQAKQAKEKQEAERLALEAKLAEELADKARNETKPDPAGSVTEDEFDALFADVVSELKADDSEQAPVIAEERDKELLKIQRLSDSDKAFLLDRINKGERVLMAIKDFGLPTIHDFQGNPNIEVDHMGYGLMKAVAPDFTIHFDAGMDMQKTPGGEAYTIVRVKIGVFPYDFDSAKKALAITAKPEPKAKPEKAPETKTQASNAVEPTEKPVKQQVKKDLERIASLGVQGMGEVLNGLHELFGGGKGTLSSFPGGLDAEAYAKAKPHFEKALALFQEAGLTLRDMIKELVLTFGEGIQPYLKQFVMEKKLSVNLQEEKQLSGSQKLAGFVAGELKADRKFTWQTLVMMGNDAFNGTMGEGAYSIKDLYDAMEAGVNQYILSLDKYNPHGKSVAQARQLINDLNGMLDNIPTQTKRTAEMDEFQQFSTPPTEAFAANWVANVQAGETMLEPSAGIGGLAIFSKLAGANIVLNELSQRRAGVLQEVFPGVKVYTENAEQLANVLPAEIQPSVIVMNPPFSSTAGRMEGKRNTMNGAKHIEQALKKLAPNGRLVAIVGQGMSMDAPAFKKWWAELQKKYAVRANISVNGAEYRKYGTTYDNQLLVIDKVILSQPIDVVTGRAETIADLIPLLEGIRNERIRPNIQETESTAPEPRGKQTDDSGGKGLLPGTKDTGADENGERQPGELDNANGTGLPGQRGHRVSNNGSGKTRTGKGHGNNKSENGGQNLDEQPESGGSGTGGDNGQHGLSIESTHRAPKEGAISDSIYENYQPAFLKIPGSKDHPGKLVESAAMAAVDPPKPTYTPNLPKATITQGKLSLAQLETTVYAGQSFEKFLKDGPRRGFMCGDGTGTGKGREIAGVILDAIRSGHGNKKAVWLSASSGLFNDSKDYYGEIGGDAAKVFQQASGFDAPKEKEGVLFASYDWLRTEDSKTKTLNEAGQIRGHVDTLVAWLGKDFDGVIAFDESHKMQNAQTQSGKNASKTALAGIRLQELLPQARILYASATAATEVSNLLYADRLGLWGKGTAFSNKGDFVNQIVSAGTAAMEFVAQGMKAAGVYLSRSLSFDGVTQGMINHELTPDQKDIYNGLAETWQNLWLQMRSQAVENGDKKFRGASLFWGQQQRFFNAAITALSMPSVIESAKADLERGESVLFQLTNTGKAQQDREVARGERENLQLEDLDFSPKQSMVDMVKELYPIFLYEPYTDDNGNEQTRLVTQPDANGDPQPVVNQEALANRDALIKNIEGVRVLDNPLDMIIDAFGVENVAEVTGRNARYVWEKDKDGAMKRVKHALSKNSRDKDVNAFMDGKKQVLIFSEAGGTGFSYHADNTRLNKNHRNHYLVQAGWQANKAIQGLGRSHRTNEASQPHYWLVTTDLRGQKRFISSIARRLDQLGALTRGQRETGGQGMFNAADNLENAYASGALKLFLRDMYDGQIEGMTLDNMASAKLGFDNLINQQTGQFNENNVPKTTQFLNRMLSLTYEDQNRVFEEFANRIDELVTTAKQNGTYDEGIKTLHAQKIEKVSEETLYQDTETGALAKFVTLKLTHPMNFNDFESMQGLSSLANWQGFYWDKKNKRIAGVLKSGTKTQASGLVTNRGSVYLPAYKSSQKIYIDDLAKITDGKQKFGEKVMIPKYNGPVLYEEYHDEYYQRREGSQQVAVMLEHPNGEQEFKKNLENIKYQKRKEALEALYEKMKPHMGEQEVSIQVPQFEEKTKAEAAVLWQKGIAESPETFAETVNMIKGVILPIWDRIPGSTVGIRAQTADGEVIIGRDIQNKDVAELRRNFALGSLVSKLSGNEQWAKLNAGSEGTLSNGWRLNQVRVSGDKRIELIMSMATSGDVRMVESIGVFGEKISGSWSTRYFVPSETVFSALTELKPLVELEGLESTATTGSNEDSIALLNLGSNRVNMNGVDYFSARAVVERVVAASKENWNVDIIAVPSFDALSSEVKKDTINNYGKEAAKEAKGITHKGKVYIIAKNSDSIADIEATILHEVEGHIGIHRLFGNDIKQQLNALYIAIGGRSGLTKLVKSRGIAADINGYAKLIGKSQFSDDVRIQVMMDEVLAHYAQHPKFGDRVKSIIGAIRSWLRQHGFLKLSSYGDTDLLNILREGRKQLKKSSDVTTEMPMLRMRDDYTPEAKAVKDTMKSDRTLAKLTPRQRLDKAKNLWATKVNQKVFDRYRSFKDVLHNETAWMMSRLSGNTGGVVEMAIEQGHPELDASGAVDINMAKKSLTAAAKPLQGEIDDAMLWMAALRAEKENAKADIANSKQAVLKAEIKSIGLEIRDMIYNAKTGSSTISAAGAKRVNELRKLMLMKKQERRSLLKRAAIRERYITPDKIIALKTMTDGVMADGANRADVYEQFRLDYEDLNNAIVKIAVDTGTIDKDEAQRWSNEGFYVPFFRFLADETSNGPKTLDSLANNTAYHHYKGSAKPLDDILVNVIGNWHHLIDSGLKNQAATQAVNAAVDMGLMEKVDSAIVGTTLAGKPIIKTFESDLFIRENGKKVEYRLTDPNKDEGKLVLDSLLSMNYSGLNNVFMTGATKASSLLRFGVVANPAFKARNLIRDTLQALAAVNVGYNPVKNVYDGWQATKPDAETITRMIGSAGAFGDSGYLFMADSEKMLKHIKRDLQDQKVANTKDKLLKLWDAYADFGARLENVNRAVAFEKTLKETGNLLKAANEANDLLAFQAHGSSKALYELTRVVPFLNAGLQGIDKMVRSAGNEATAKRFWTVTSMYVAASVILALGMAGDDDYDQAEEFDKETYHLFKIPGSDTLYKLPRPFEIGAMASIAERIAQQIVAESPDPKFAAVRIMNILGSQMRLNPVPQVVKPVLEVWANKNMFTGRDIESQGLLHQRKSERAYASTSLAGKGIASALSLFGDETPITSRSPVEVEHLINAYLGWLGSFALSGTDAILRPLLGETAPSGLTTTPFLGKAAADLKRAFVADESPRNTKFTTTFYDNLKTLESIAADMRHARELGNTERVSELRGEYGKQINYVKAYRRASTRIGLLNKQVEKVWASSLTGDEKRTRIDAINKQRNNIAKLTAVNLPLR